ncbi:MAG TPA: alpha/beta hydrolase [bacterium]|nr:alpha/beta hydrolase [bacterium]HEX68356.1 alpha/beta hydrolase [bacterium]
MCEEKILIPEVEVELTLLIFNSTFTPLIFLPGLGTSKRKMELIRFLFLSSLAEKGYPVIIYPSYGRDKRKFFRMRDGEMWEFFQFHSYRIKKIMDWLEEKKKWHKFNLMGMSLGGMLGMMLLSEDERTRKGIFMGVGGDFEKILWQGALRFLLPKDCSRKQCHLLHEKYRKILKRGNFTELHSLPRYCFLYDPLTSAMRIKNKKVLLIHGLFDEVIPYPAFLTLKKALPQASSLLLPLTHTTLFLFLPLIKWRIEKFLKDE